MTAPARLASALADRYRIERELGAGGMATVYLAEDLKHRRKVAIKVLRPELSAVLGGERFLKEIELTASLQHPSILPLFDSGSVDGLLYYVMPFVEGETLRARLEREHQLPIPEAVRIASAVGAALDYAHRHGAVHRDIKPENILLSDGNALVADFGIALALRDAGGARLTETGLSLGTPQYMSPEQATAERTVDARTDIYSLGAVLYEMLAGEPPFTAPTTQGVIAKLLTQSPVHLRLLRDTVTPRLDIAVDRMLAKLPADRFATCREVIDALASASGGTTPTRTRSVSVFGSENRRWTVPLLAGLAAATLLTAAWATLRNRAPAAALPLERVQLTFTGNAMGPGISHDGTRVAYSTRQCDSTGRCTQNIVVQDVAGAGTSTVLRDALFIGEIRWTPDGRHLVFRGSFGRDRDGVFSMPSLGGEPRFLGCCRSSMGDGDTVLVTALALRPDTVAWVRWITAPDGVVQDSLAVGLFGSERLVFVQQLSPGRGLVASYFRQQSNKQVVMTRSGQVTDSVSFRRPNAPRCAFLTPDREQLGLCLPHPGRAQDYDLVLYPVSASGRFGKPDTVYRQLTYATSGDGEGDAMVYDYGPSDYSVWAIVREGPASMKWSQRRLAMATERMSGFVSNSGDRVAIVRGAGSASGKDQLSVMPFDSGPETPLGPALDLLAADWSPGDESLVIAARLGTDSVAIRRVDVRTGRSTPIVAIPGSDFKAVKTLPGGGILLLFPREFQRIGVPGLPDSTFALPSLLARLDASPDGRAFVAAGFNSSLDTTLVHRVSVVDGSAIRLVNLIGENIRAPKWIDDGSIILPIMETASTMVWYRIPSAGGRAVRLGAPPRFPAEYGISANGRHAVATVEDRHTDIYMIRNFGGILKAK